MIENIAYFSDIHKVIIQNIKNAKKMILIAVAWFSDKDIYNALLEKKQKSNIQIRIILANHEFNKKGHLNFSDLIQEGVIIDFIGENGDNKTRLMHNKFCLIDDDIVINGSFNWSYKARFNDENIIITKGDYLLFNQFYDKFNSINPQQQITINSNGEMVLVDKIAQKWQINNVTLVDNKSNNIIQNISSKF